MTLKYLGPFLWERPANHSCDLMIFFYHFKDDFRICNWHFFIKYFLRNEADGPPARPLLLNGGLWPFLVKLFSMYLRYNFCNKNSLSFWLLLSNWHDFVIFLSSILLNTFQRPAHMTYNLTTWCRPFAYVWPRQNCLCFHNIKIAFPVKLTGFRPLLDLRFHEAVRGRLVNQTYNLKLSYSLWPYVSVNLFFSK